MREEMRFYRKICEAGKVQESGSWFGSDLGLRYGKELFPAWVFYPLSIGKEAMNEPTGKRIIFETGSQTIISYGTPGFYSKEQIQYLNALITPS
jgi:hypothetical protein